MYILNNNMYFIYLKLFFIYQVSHTFGANVTIIPKTSILNHFQSSIIECNSNLKGFLSNPAGHSAADTQTEH